MIFSIFRCWYELLQEIPTFRQRHWQHVWCYRGELMLLMYIIVIQKIEKRYAWIPRKSSFRYILFHEKATPNNAVTPQRLSQFTPKMKANAEPRLLSSLVWIDQDNKCNGMISFMEFISTYHNHSNSDITVPIRPFNKRKNHWTLLGRANGSALE